MKICKDLSHLIDKARLTLINTGKEIHTEKWQSTNIKDKPSMAMWEALFISLMAPMPEKKLDLEQQVLPNQPWADVHFKERISGLPLNPGESYKEWPFYKMDEAMRTEGAKFSHSYMERYWPKYSNPDPKDLKKILLGPGRYGIRYTYGDLGDVITLLKNEPDTRQAYLPVWFPEDTGNRMQKRVPCSIGYHFIRRDGYLHLTYTMRSCDFLRHFRDDIYLTVRLAQFFLDELQADGKHMNLWKDTKLGYIKMDITSLHIFKQELSILEKNG